MFTQFIFAFFVFVVALSVHRTDRQSPALRPNLTMAAAGELALPPLPYDCNALEPHIDEVRFVELAAIFMAFTECCMQATMRVR